MGITVTKFTMKSPELAVSGRINSIAVKVAVDNAAFMFDRLYSYTVPRELAERAVPGARVVVPFGRGDRPRVGVIVEKCEPEMELKSLLFCEAEPALSPEQLKMLVWLKETTFCSYFDAVKAIMPKLSRVAVKNEDGHFAFSEKKRGYSEVIYIPCECESLTPRMRQIAAAAPAEGASVDELRELTGASRATISKMAALGGFKKVERLLKKPVYRCYTPRGESFSLFSEQSEAYQSIVGRIEEGKRETLLHGITSSGKTIIYIKLMEYMLERGLGVIMLVPEIAIATQTIYRLRELFGDEVAVIHSRLSDSERQLQWLAVKNGECRVVAGTRSAVFAPMDNVGLIIIDEEQEQSYISEQSPRYSAVAAARERAQSCGCHLLLGSATPSVGEYYRAKAAKAIVKLEKRYLELPLPEVALVDMRAELISGNTGFISSRLKQEIESRLIKNEQVVLLLNRRGYYTVSICKDCKEVRKCPNCDVPLVYHKDGDRLSCHYCGHTEEITPSCPICGGELKFKGLGTQRAEEQLEELYPSARVLRLDFDSTARRGEFETKLADFSAGKYDILIGTQMIAKGLDFANVTLAAVIGLDQMMLMQSYRVYERAFSLITQLVGRSGRGPAGGSAIIQTVDPENPVIGLAVRQDYDSFYNTEIKLRQACLYPPFCAMYTVGFSGESEDKVNEAGRAFAAIIARMVKQAGNIPVRLLGPSPFRIHYMNKAYRCKLTLKSRGDSTWNRLLETALLEFYGLREFADVRVFIDTNCDDY